MMQVTCCIGRASAADGLTKFDGIAACVAQAPFDLDAYDYVAVPDDDIICTRDDWNDAFDLRASTIWQHVSSVCTHVPAVIGHSTNHGVASL
jgi:hypothetical protein